MSVAIAGGHGKVARRLAQRLLERGDQVRGLIRNPDHADDLRADRSEPVVRDLEKSTVEEVANAVAGADAVVFAAGAGPGSGAERKWTMDRDGVPTVPTSIALAAAAAQDQVSRLRGRVNEVTPNGVRYLAQRRGTYGIAKARELLGWTPAVGLDEGMSRTEGWLREQGLL